jgi:hypothetical protein
MFSNKYNVLLIYFFTDTLNGNRDDKDSHKI